MIVDRFYVEIPVPGKRYSYRYTFDMHHFSLDAVFCAQALDVGEDGFVEPMQLFTEVNVTITSNNGYDKEIIEVFDEMACMMIGEHCSGEPVYVVLAEGDVEIEAVSHCTEIEIGKAFSFKGKAFIRERR